MQVRQPFALASVLLSNVEVAAQLVVQSGSQAPSQTLMMVPLSRNWNAC